MKEFDLGVTNFTSKEQATQSIPIFVQMNAEGHAVLWDETHNANDTFNNARVHHFLTCKVCMTRGVANGK